MLQLQNPIRRQVNDHCLGLSTAFLTYNDPGVMWQPGNRGSKQNTNYWCCEIYFYGHTNNNNCDYDNNNDNGKKP